MELLVVIALAAALVYSARGLFLRPRTSFAITNAMLAEHDLSYIELVPENPFALTLAQIVSILQRGISGSTVEYVVDLFNRTDRIGQLNVVALALGEIGFSPMLGEPWRYVRSPLSIGSIEPHFLKGEAERLRRKYSVSVTIPNRRFKIEGWGLADLRP